MKSTINFGYLIFLSVVAALGGFLFGYDTAVISGTIAQVTQLFQLDTLQQGDRKSTRLNSSHPSSSRMPSSA